MFITGITTWGKKPKAQVLVSGRKISAANTLWKETKRLISKDNKQKISNRRKNDCAGKLRLELNLDYWHPQGQHNVDQLKKNEICGWE